MQLAALVIGTKSLGKSKPIIGPPIIKCVVLVLAPPAAATNAFNGVPNNTSKFCGTATLPVMVTTRLIEGSPNSK